MASQVPVQLDEDVFRELQQRAEPLIDDINSVIRRLLSDSWSERTPPAAVREVNLARGGRLPVGLSLRAIFRDKRFEAEVTEEGILFDGKTYDSLSAAARAAKACAGVSERASQTNGWKFWQYLDARSHRYEPLALFRSPTAPGGRRRLSMIGAGPSEHTDTGRLSGEVGLEPASWR
jgi:hypothetical protein